MVVIAVLAIIWVVALTPMILRKLSERRFTTSVDSFHRQLRGLRRAYPRLAASAAHPEVTLSMGRVTPAAGRPLDSGGHLDSDKPSDFTDSGRAGSWTVEHAQVHAAGRGPSHGSRRVSGPAVRRRRVILILLAMMLGFFLLGMIPVMRVLWDASLLAFGAMAAYLALLIHFHRRAMERDVKVVDLQGRRSEPRVSVRVNIAPRSHIPTGPAHAGATTWTEDDLINDDLLDDRRFDGEIVAGGR